MKSSTHKLCSLKYSCEEVYERMENGLCIFCEEEDTPGHQQLKHKRSRIVIREREDDLASDVKEEAHQILETVTNPEPTLETTKDSDSFIKPLVAERELVSVSDVLMVRKMDSHVKEVKALTQQSISGSGKIIAHQVFDQIPIRVTSKVKQRKYLKGWKFKFKTSPRRSKLMGNKLSLVEKNGLLNKDLKEKKVWDHVNKEFKVNVAARRRKTIDRFKLVGETLKSAVYYGSIQIRVWDSGGSPFQCVDEESFGDDTSSEVFTSEIVVKLVYKPLTDDKCSFVDESSGKDVSVLEAQQEFKTRVFSGFHFKALFELKFNGWEYKKQILILKRPYVDVFLSLTDEILMTGKEFHDLFLFNQVWEPGGTLAGQVHGDRLEEFYSDGEALKLRQGVYEISFMGVAKELAHVMDIGIQINGLRSHLLVSLTSEGHQLLVCLYVHGMNFEVVIEISISAHHNVRNQKLLLTYYGLNTKEFPQFEKLHWTGLITKTLSPPILYYKICRKRFCRLTWYSSVGLEEWKHELEIDFDEYKTQILLLSNHDLEVKMLSWLQGFGLGTKGIHAVVCLLELKSICWVGYNGAVGLSRTKLLAPRQKMQSIDLFSFCCSYKNQNSFAKHWVLTSIKVELIISGAFGKLSASVTVRFGVKIIKGDKHEPKPEWLEEVLNFVLLESVCYAGFSGTKRESEFVSMPQEFGRKREIIEQGVLFDQRDVIGMNTKPVDKITNSNPAQILIFASATNWGYMFGIEQKITSGLIEDQEWETISEWSMFVRELQTVKDRRNINYETISALLGVKGEYDLHGRLNGEMSLGSLTKKQRSMWGILTGTETFSYNGVIIQVMVQTQWESTMMMLFVIAKSLILLSDPLVASLTQNKAVTKVLIQWKEHPPDRFIKLSSLRTRMLSTGEYCNRISKYPGSVKSNSQLSYFRFSYSIPVNQV